METQFTKRVIKLLHGSNHIFRKGEIYMGKIIHDALTRYAERRLDEKLLELLTIEQCEVTNKENGEVSKFIKLEVEVPRGYDEFSRCRFAVKVPDGKLLVTNESLENTDFLVAFKGLTISYMDGSKNVYFRADDYTIKKEAK